MSFEEQVAIGKQYYDEKKATNDYHEDPSGFLYRFITDGQTGKGESNNSSPKPALTDKVQVHYEGKLINGTVFDSSYQRNEKITFGLNQVIKGWGKALTHMSFGDKIECILPQELAYGQRGAGKDIPGGATLIFIIEYFETKKPEAQIEGEKYYAEQKATGEWKEHPAGFLYKWLSPEPAEDAEKPTARDMVTVHYHGTTINGSVFDSSVQRGKTIEFGLGQVIQGWTICCQLCSRGSKIKVILPADLAYGDKSPTPAIRAGETLIFEIELFDFKPNPQPDCTVM